MTVLYVFIAILMFGFLIFSHELGHYVFARIFKVKINEFAIGMGPKLFGKESSKTGIRYSVRALPIGGYVSMVGEDGESDEPNAFCKKPVWQRMIITAAGGITNLLTGFIAMTLIVVFSTGMGTTVVGDFPEENASSYLCGLRADDEIVEIDGTRVHVYSELSYEIMHKGIKPVELTVIRNGQTVTLKDVIFPTQTEQGHEYGVMDFRVYGEEKTVGSVISQSFYQSCNTVKMIWESLIDIIKGNYGIKDMSGPVGVTEAITTAAQTGSKSLFTMFVFIAVNLGLFNLLPLPALDGGRLFFQFIELIFRRPVNRKVEGMIHTVGLVCLLALMAVITCKDIIGLM